MTCLNCLHIENLVRLDLLGYRSWASLYSSDHSNYNYFTVVSDLDLELNQRGLQPMDSDSGCVGSPEYSGQLGRLDQ